MTDLNVWQQEADALLRGIDTDFETADLPLPERIALAQAWGTLAVAEELNLLRLRHERIGDDAVRTLQETARPGNRPGRLSQF